MKIQGEEQRVTQKGQICSKTPSTAQEPSPRLGLRNSVYGMECVSLPTPQQGTASILGQLPAPVWSLWAAPSRGQMRLHGE